LFGVFIYIINIHLESKVFVKTNEYANYQILDFQDPEHGKGKILSSNESASSFLRADKSSLWYVEEIKKVLFKDMALTDKDILILGSGGFTITAQGDYGNRVVYNDIDGEIEQIALNGFIDKVNGEFVVDDARRLLRETKKKYDVIISDAYTNRISVPAHLLTVEYMQSVRDALKPGGLAIFNTIMKSTLEETFGKRVDNTIRTVFPSCNVVPYRHNNALVENVLYFCTLSKFENDKTVYTDNKNTASLDFFAR
jgi:spermidine synthase